MDAAAETTLEFYKNKTIKIFTTSGFAFDGEIKEVGTEFFTFTDDRGVKSLIAIKSIERIKEGGK
jgi:hypothetical protein